MPEADDARLTNLLGVVALAAHDRLTPGRSASEAGALAHLLDHPASSVERLRNALGLSQPATVRVADRLQADGLLERRAGADRRTLALVLTPAGEREAQAMLDVRAAGLAPLLDGLDGGDRRELERLLHHITARLPNAERTCRLCDRTACYSGAPCPLDRADAEA